ncbi:MAG: AmmeMemoRadiSam system protein A [Fibrobacterota bacterium]
MQTDVIVTLARKSIEKVWDEGISIPSVPDLDIPGASFVTLEKNGALRGCIGTVRPVESLEKNIRENAVNAAFRDPRFPPLSAEEYPRISVEVSLLHSFEHVSYTGVDELRKKITPGKDGVILRLGTRSATFLPQVWEKLPDFTAFFTHLCAKAGFDSCILDEGPEITRYTVTSYKG